MVKHFCDRCGKEMAGVGSYVLAEIRIRRGLPTGTHEIELCMDCVGKAFGEGFSARCEAEYAEKKKAAQERMAARKAQKAEQEGGQWEVTSQHTSGENPLLAGGMCRIARTVNEG